MGEEEPGAPSYEEMTPEQQTTHDAGAPQQEAAEISEEVRIQQVALDLAREKGLDVEAVKNNLAAEAHERALQENKEKEMSNLVAQSILEVATNARLSGKNPEVTFPLLPSKTLGEAQRVLGAKFIDGTVSLDKSGLSGKEEHISYYEIPGIGGFAQYFGKIDPENPGETKMHFRGLKGLRGF